MFFILVIFLFVITSTEFSETHFYIFMQLDSYIVYHLIISKTKSSLLYEIQLNTD